MKIRRSLALAAATAAVAPAMFLSVPAAFAADGQSTAVTDTTPTDGETEGTDTTAPGTEDTTPTGEQTTEATTETSASETTPADDTASESATSTASTSASASASDEPSASASTSASPSASVSPSGLPECDDSREPSVDEHLRTGISGLPSKIVAGSGFHGFELNVKNTGENSYKRVDLGVFAAQVNHDDLDADTSHLTLQYKDPESGRWVNISLDENDEGAGYLGYTDVQAHESFSIDLRLAVDSKAPAGQGFAISIGMYADDKGNCVYADDESYYEFNILAAGSQPGHPGDAKPQGGRKPLPTKKPTGNTQIDPQGTLASTGSSSALPTLALAGGAAVALGVGAVFIVRRRKTSGTNTAV
ncbi:LPXTG cell wall anchor domain-containing protein [Streptomyces sp. J2-1]|uniref:LPXTG cell wall anchor domain-containing protein n=1 Tax=Streptomyces corallincola TaxID=2851888 RepID=UPI001C38F8E7|nr:LPXTG cell wall anchor domain-containing protein [Streptomyces corallincola]MBV2355387.1 LPXTG cell wall anchor domain-containing protein [Streptomyces corallincola]